MKRAATRTPTDAASDAGRALTATAIAMMTIPPEARALPPDNFVEAVQGEVWRLCRELHDRGDQITPHALAMLAAQRDVTKRLPDGGAAGWAEKLAADHAVVLAQIPQLVAIVKAQASRRRIEHSTTEILASAQRGRPVEELAAALTIAAKEAQTPTETAPEVVIPPRISDAAIVEWSKPLPPALATPFEPLNCLLAGGLRGLNALVAATGLGKTSLALLLGRQAAVTVPVLYVSTELGCRQAIARIAGQILRQPWRALWEGEKVTGQAIAQVTASLNFRCMEYRDTGEMFAIANAIATAEGKAPFLILDYLQGAARDPGIDRRLAVSGVSNALLQWCRATDAVALMVSSTARVSYALPDKVARDLVGTAKESGDTEYDCSAVLYAELEPCPLGGSAAGVLHVAKSRFGTVGVVGVSFDGPSGLFTLDDSGLNPLERKILGAIRAGHHSANAIQAAVGKQRKKVLEALCAMRDRNLIDADYNITSALSQEPRQNGQNAARLPGTSSQSGSGTGTTLTFPSLTSGSGTGTAPCGFGTGSHPLRGEPEPPTEPAAEDDPDGGEVAL